VRPVLMSGAVVARQLMNLSSSFDHRVIDGAQAAGFVQGLRSYLEQPATLSTDSGQLAVFPEPERQHQDAVNIAVMGAAQWAATSGMLGARAIRSS